MAHAEGNYDLTLEGASLDSEGQDIYNCRVCYEDLLSKEPRTLACNHTYCTVCLQQIYEVDSRSIRCPECRKINPLPSGDVTDLPRNFLLQQTRDRELRLRRDQQQREQQPTFVVPYCEVCHQHEPISKCEDCNHKMCQVCTDRHIKVPAYKDHTLLMLCLTHKLSLKLLCKRCIEPLCQKCVLLNHGDHTEETEELTEGAKSMKTEFKELIETLEKVLENVNVHSDEINGKLQRTRNVLSGIRTRCERFEGLVTEAKQRIAIIEETCEKPAADLSEILECQTEQTKEAVCTLQSALNLENVEFIRKYSSSRDPVETLLVILSEVLTQNCDEAIVDLAPENSGYIFNPVQIAAAPKLEDEVIVETVKTVETVKNYDKPKMTLDMMELENMSVKIPEQIEFLYGNFVLLVDWSLPYVCCLDQDGEVVSKFYGREKGQPLKGCQVEENSIILVQSNTITKINLSFPSEQPIHVFNPNIEKMSKLVCVTEDQWVIASFRGESIHEYNSTDGSSKVLAQNLKGPSHVKIFKDGTSLKFIITMRNGHHVAIFDENWNQVAQLGEEGSQDGQLKFPGACVVTPGGVVMVTDWANNRISKFSLDGTFLGHLLRENDGIQAPIGIALKHPRMWITEQSPGANYAAIKSFIFE